MRRDLMGQRFKTFKPFKRFSGAAFKTFKPFNRCAQFKSFESNRFQTFQTFKWFQSSRRFAPFSFETAVEHRLESFCSRKPAVIACVSSGVRMIRTSFLLRSSLFS
jgi:hypothetical protein